MKRALWLVVHRVRRVRCTIRMYGFIIVTGCLLKSLLFIFLDVQQRSLHAWCGAKGIGGVNMRMKGDQTTITRVERPTNLGGHLQPATSPNHQMHTRLCQLDSINTTNSTLLTCSWRHRHSSLCPLCGPPHRRHVVCTCNCFDDKE